MSATIRDIKRITGLSLATISKYLNGGNVLQKNRIAIESAIKELNYEVNEVARGLATNKSKTIGVLIYMLDSVFNSTIVTYIEDILRKHNYAIIVCDYRGDLDLAKEKIRFFIQKRVDGIITIPIGKNSRYLNDAIKRNIPIVLIDSIFKNNLFDCVLVDNFNAAKDAVNILYRYGHKEIGIICGEESAYTASERFRGYKQGLIEKGINIEEKFIKRGELSVEFGYKAMKYLMYLKKRPTAVFLSNYEITLGAIIAINELGIRFPENLSLIGFDNMILAEVVNPKLWMISQPLKEIGKYAATIMLEKLEGEYEGKNRKIVLSTDVVKGKSIKKM